MNREQPEHDTIRTMIDLASRAPSIHNSQPWLWELHGNELRLYADYRFAVPAADPHGRQLTLSLGAHLDHFRAASAAQGWATNVTRLPNPVHRDHLATVEFTSRQTILDGFAQRSKAMRERFTDRLPMHSITEQELRDFTDRVHSDAYNTTHSTLLPSETKPGLARASRASSAARRYDAAYHDELDWWTEQPSTRDYGIPASSLLSSSEAQRVAVGRDFPHATTGQPRRRNIPADQACILLLSSYSSSTLDVLRCGEALSELLLDAVTVGLSTCIVSHVFETPTGRAIVRQLVDDTAEPQVLVRVGRRDEAELPTPTPRRPVDDVFRIVGNPR